MQSLVMIPGLGSDRAVWQPTIDALDGKLACVVGDTSIDATLAAMARRILISAPPRFALAGVSMGGMVALELMKLAPERVSHLALVDTSARPDTAWKKVYRRLAILVAAMTRDFRRASARSVSSLVHASAPDDVRVALTDMGARVGPEVFIRQNGALIGRSDLRPGLSGIAVPTAVVVGRDDRLTPVGVSEELRALIPGSTLHVIPDCGHLPPIERPKIMASLLEALVSG